MCHPSSKCLASVFVSIFARSPERPQQSSTSPDTSKLEKVCDHLHKASNQHKSTLFWWQMSYIVSTLMSPIPLFFSHILNLCQRSCFVKPWFVPFWGEKLGHDVPSSFLKDGDPARFAIAFGKVAQAASRVSFHPDKGVIPRLGKNWKTREERVNKRNI